MQSLVYVGWSWLETGQCRKQCTLDAPWLHDLALALALAYPAVLFFPAHVKSIALEDLCTQDSSGVTGMHHSTLPTHC